MSDVVLNSDPGLYADAETIGLPNPCRIKIGDVVLCVSIEPAKPQNESGSSAQPTTGASVNG